MECVAACAAGQVFIVQQLPVLIKQGDLTSFLKTQLKGALSRIGEKLKVRHMPHFSRTAQKIYFCRNFR